MVSLLVSFRLPMRPLPLSLVHPTTQVVKAFDASGSVPRSGRMPGAGRCRRGNGAIFRCRSFGGHYMSMLKSLIVLTFGSLLLGGCGAHEDESAAQTDTPSPAVE